MVERLAARDRRRERDLELLLQPLLPDELGQVARPQRAVELLLAGVLEDAGARKCVSLMPPLLKASRTRSSAGRFGSMSASARSASSSEIPELDEGVPGLDVSARLL